MKRRVVLLLVLIVLCGLAAGWWWTRTSPDQAVAFLVSGGLEQGRAEQFVSAASGLLGVQTTTDKPDILIASGSIEGETVSIVSEFGGRIVGLHAVEGDEVAAGEVLVRLDDALLRAQMAQAEAAVSAAETNLLNVQAATHPAEILAAQAALQVALAERDAAWTAWQDTLAILDNPQEIDAKIVEAESAITVAETQIEQAQAQLAAAKADLARNNAQGSMEEKYLYAAYSYRVDAAQAALDAARANRKGAKDTLAALRALRKNPLVLASRAHMAEAQYEIAAAGVGVSSAKLAELKAGPLAEDVAVAEAQIAKAQAAVDALETQIEKMELPAPMTGLVTSISAHQGEVALPGATLLTIANLDDVKLTIYVPEDELGRVYLGQEVEVQVDSFPGLPFVGTVSHVSEEAEFTPKNVQTAKDRVNMVFAVRVRLANPDHLLKPGMPADAYLDR